MPARAAARGSPWAAAALLGLALAAGCAAGCAAGGEAPGPGAATQSQAAPGLAKHPPPAAPGGCADLDPGAGPAAPALQDGGAFLDLPTYDGSNQSTHLNVQFREAGAFGHRYWMTLTPYPDGDASKENPSVLVSDNGLEWAPPAGVANPVSGVPADAAAKGHYSDGYLLIQADQLELYFRYNPARPGLAKPDNATSIIYRVTSPDGIAWSQPETVFEGGAPDYMSPSLLADGPLRRLWYSNYGGHMVYTESRDLQTWAEPQPVEIELSQGYLPWHQEIVPTDLGYEALVLGYKPGPDGRTQFALYHARSGDGLRFGPASLIDPERVDPRLKGYHFYKSSLVKTCGAYRLYLSTVTPGGAYRPFYKQIAAERLPELFG
ncbi:MAG: hypothetical protein LBD51_06380 [Bifidobacteriaceae bacterium]|jgi:hypothetical protein|nr:hypothetical protein [Bifidobacteriaceae bacterium]